MICLECMSRSCEHIAPKNMPPRLSRRHAQVVKLVGEGHANKEIGYRLGITEGTVKMYMKTIFALLGADSRLRVGLWARDHQDLLNAT